jgi:hypothetical protein
MALNVISHHVGRWRRRRLPLLVFAVLAAAPARASAQAEAPAGIAPAPREVPPREDTYDTPRGVGLGIGNRAGATGTSAVAYNPANLPIERLYLIESMFGYIPNERAFAVGGAVADSITNKLAAGTAFRGVFGNGDRNFSGWDGRVSLGMPVLRQLSLGVSGRYVRLHADDRTEDDQPVGEHVKGFTVDAAVTVTPLEGFHISVLAYNLVNLRSSLAPQRVGGGVSYQFRDVFQVGVDTLVDLSTFDHASVVIGGGAEYVLADVVPLRLGFQEDTGRHMGTLTAGVGYRHPKFGVDLSLRQDFAAHRQSYLLLGLSYHVQ